MTRKLTITLIVLLILSFAFGLAAGMKIGGGETAAAPGIRAVKPGDNTFQAGWEAAKKRLSDSGFYPMMAGPGMDIRNVSGEVREVKDNKIILKIRPLEPLSDPALDERIIMAGDDTKVYRMEQRDPEAFRAEMEAFNKKMEERMKDPANLPAEPVMPPEMYARKEISLSDIKTGEQINVMSDGNIKDAKEIKAVEISSQSAPAMPDGRQAMTVPPMMPPADMPPLPAAPVADDTPPAPLP
jgi:hypothetical protein